MRLVVSRDEGHGHRKVIRECILAILSSGPMKPRAFEDFGDEGRNAFWYLIDHGYVVITRDQKLSLTEHFWNERNEVAL